MKRIIAVSVFSVASIILSACVTPEQLAAADDSRCQSYGFGPGSDGYAQCRERMDENRQQMRAALLGAMIQNNQQSAAAEQRALEEEQQALRQAAQPAPQVNCITSYVGNQAYTNCR